MKKIGLLCLLLFQLQAFAQVDLAAISKEVTNSSSSAYYPTLLNRFQVSDTTLVEQDFVYLYYGFISQPAYKPRVIDTLEVEVKERNRATDYIGAYELADSVLKVYPMSIG